MNEKSTYQPPYTITPEILNRVASISETIGRLTVCTDQARAMHLRRINRIRTADDYGYGDQFNPGSHTESHPRSSTTLSSCRGDDPARAQIGARAERR